MWTVGAGDAIRVGVVPDACDMGVADALNGVWDCWRVWVRPGVAAVEVLIGDAVAVKWWE